MGITVFICGAVMMVLELTGVRILSPVIGASIFVWTGIICVILGSLSAGYFLGGKLADKKASKPILSDIIFASSISVLPVLAFAELQPMNQLIIHDPRVISFLLSVLLFTLPGLLLGMITPFVLKIKLKSLNKTGTTAGKLFEVSTIGSIFGTFITGYFLFSVLGSNKIILLLCFILLITSFIVDFHRKISLRILILIVIIFLYLYLDNAEKILNKNILASYDSAYNKILIYDTNEKFSAKPVRFLKLNNEYTSAMYLYSNDLVFKYTRYFRLAGHFNKKINKSLMIGGGAYSYPKEFLQRFPKSEVDVVEIDPKVTLIAKKYFKLEENPHLKIYNQDARMFINKDEKKYDAIFIDIFNSNIIPYYLTTIEAVKHFKNNLNRNGVILTNIISAIDGKKSGFLLAEFKTYASVFPQVFVYAVKNRNDNYITQNLILVALNSDSQPQLENSPELTEYLSNKVEISDRVLRNSIVLTDNYSPIEYYALQNLIN